MQNNISPNMPWQKWPHRQYLLSQTRARLSLVERGAFHELKDIAATQCPFASVPDDDDAIAGWLTITVKQWRKIKEKVLHDWILEGNRYYLPMLLHIAVDTSSNSNDGSVSETQPIKPKEKKTVDPELSAKRSAAAKQGHAKRSANLHASSANAPANFADDDANTMQNVDAKHAHAANMQNPDLQNTANLHANEGGKGGDLDLNSDKDLDKKQKKQRDVNANASRVLSGHALEIFEHWKKVFSKRGDVIFSDKRKGKVIARLQQGYSVSQIKQAIDNCAKSDFHVTNQHTGLDLICRDPEQLDKFIDYVPAPAKQQQPTGQQSYSASEEPADHQEYSDGITYGLLRQSMRAGETYQICFTRLITLQRLKPAEREGFLLLEEVKPGVTVEDVRILAKANEVTFTQAVTFLREQIEMELEPS